MSSKLSSVSVIAIVFLGLTASSILSTAFLLRFFSPESLRGIVQNKASQGLLDDANRIDYTFVGDDFPRYLALDSNPVAMTMEESVHYRLTGPEAFEEWLYTSPPGTGIVHLGPDMRAFELAVFHQLHCLRYFRNLLSLETDGTPLWPHVQHCLTYMRQWILCHADVTLEPGDFKTRNFTADREGETHVCRDWSPVYEEMRSDHVAWLDYSGNHDFPDKIPV